MSNLDKLYWPDDGITKGDLADYYEGVSEWMLPHVSFRPVRIEIAPRWHMVAERWPVSTSQIGAFRLRMQSMKFVM